MQLWAQILNVLSINIWKEKKRGRDKYNTKSGPILNAIVVSSARRVCDSCTRIIQTTELQASDAYGQRSAGLLIRF